MSKFIIIEADINDGDYVTKRTPISDEDIKSIKKIFKKLPKQKDCLGNLEIRYETFEDSDPCEYLTSEEIDKLGNFLPNGDYNYTGIHTIVSVEIVEQIEKIL